MTHSALQPRRARTEPLQSRSPANFCIRLVADVRGKKPTSRFRQDPSSGGRLSGLRFWETGA